MHDFPWQVTVKQGDLQAIIQGGQFRRHGAGKLDVLWSDVDHSLCLFQRGIARCYAPERFFVGSIKTYVVA